MAAGEWFTVALGEYEGKVTLAGWEFSAVGSGPGMGSPWYAIATCPRCGACCSNDDTSGERMRGRAIWRHEDWHAETDYPRPSPGAAR